MRLDAVIVTYNRLEELRECLNKYDLQKVEVDAVIVVNNCSTDGTKEYLKNWEKNIVKKYKKIVINLTENLGGSGGFYEGIKCAIKDGADWIWLHDDDAFIFEDTIEKLRKNINNCKSEDVSAVCGMVCDKDSIAYDHRRRIYRRLIKNKNIQILKKEYEKEYFELNEFSYVGVAINVEKLYRVGITNKDFFIFLDDTEHSYRLSKVGKVICFPEIKIKHDNKYVANDHKVNWKLYYSVRNRIYYTKYSLKSGYIYWILYFYAMAFVKIVIRHDNGGAKLILDAIKDGKLGKLGKHNIYKPGWKNNK